VCCSVLQLRMKTEEEFLYAELVPGASISWVCYGVLQRMLQHVLQCVAVLSSVCGMFGLCVSACLHQHALLKIYLYADVYMRI